MKNKTIRDYVLDLLMVGAGCVLLAFAITSILQQNDLMTGGVTGMSIILSKVVNINYTYLYYGISLIVLFLAFIFLGKEEGFKIIILSISFPVILIVFDHLKISFVENDMFLASLYYGLIAGAGVGLILRRGYSMGGTDTIAKFFHRRYLAFMSLSQILLIIDVIIIILSLFMFDKRVALYAIFTQFVLLKTVDVVMFGFGTKKVKMEIISESSDDIAEFIMHEVHRGITKYMIMGGYSNSQRTKIVTVCSPRETMIIKNYIASEDKDAFVDILPVSSVWGNGVGFDRIDENY